MGKACGVFFGGGGVAGIDQSGDSSVCFTMTTLTPLHVIAVEIKTSICHLSELKKVHIEVKEDIAAPPQPAASEDDEEEEEEDEDDDDEEEDEDDEDSEEEAEAEKPTVASQGKRRAPSEDESSESEDDDGRTKEERLYDRAKRRIEVRDAAKSAGVTGSLFILISD